MIALLLAAAKAGLLMVAALAAARLAARAPAALRHGVCAAGAAGALALPVLQALLPGWPAGAAAGMRAAAGSAPAVWIVAGGVWAAGSLLLLLRLAGRRVAARRFLARAAPVRDARLLSLAIDVRRELGFRRPLHLVLSREAGVPLSFGILRRHVVLPAGARRWSPARLRAVLLHEVAHHARRDDLTQLVAELACAVYWFLPPAFRLAREMRFLREVAADDRVLLRGARPSRYARLLLRSFRDGPAPIPAAAALAARHELERRVRSVLRPGRRRRARPRALAAVALAVLLLVLPLAALGGAGEVGAGSRAHRVHVHASAFASSATRGWTSVSVSSR